MIDHDRIRQIFEDPLLAPLIKKLENRLSRRNDSKGVISLRDLDLQQHDAIMAFLGRTATFSAKVQIRVAELEKRIADSGVAPSLRAALVSLLKRPLIDPRVANREVLAKWNRLLSKLSHLPGSPVELHAWIQRAVDKGILRRMVKGDIEMAQWILEKIVEAVRQFPLTAPLPLPVFAARLTGDPHALDSNRVLGRLLVRALGHLSNAKLPQSAAEIRDVWSAVGIVKDELASTVLVHGLTAGGTSLTDTVLQAHYEAGQPCRLTFRHLRLFPPTFATSAPIAFVCENPSVLASACDALGKDCLPLICVEGQPSQAANLLLMQLSKAGFSLRYHGDFDWAGIGMANAMIAKFKALPWRMNAADYLATDGIGHLEGCGVAPTWSGDLFQAMLLRRKIVMEEAVIATLLEDLQPLHVKMP